MRIRVLLALLGLAGAIFGTRSGGRSGSIPRPARRLRLGVFRPDSSS